LIIRRESKPGILMDNILLLIHYIVTQIGYDVMLIPHVVMPADNDFEFLSDLWNGLPEAEKRRTYLLDGNHSSSEYKYAVSQCAMLVCARTHVSIAAYSLGIPTLVLGYSVKAQGIALDLGMTDYVLDITKIKEASVVTEMFKHLYKDQDHICAHLKYRLPTYMADMVRVYEII
jgi:polysaccharide pyruvyl transferase WcaK-like protein